MLFFFHRYELPAVLQAHGPATDQGHDDSAQLGNEAVMPDSDILPEDTISSSQNDANSSSHELPENIADASDSSENENSNPNSSTVSSENQVKTDSKQTVQPPAEENRSSLVS